MSSCATIAFDARNFFSEKVEPLEQNQFGATVGGPLLTGPAAVLRLLRGAAQPAGNDDHGDGADRRGASRRFLGDGHAASQPRRRRGAVSRQPDSRRRDQSAGAQRAEPVSARQRVAVHLSGDAGRHRRARSGGSASISTPRRSDQLFVRYSYSGGHNVNPISVRGTDVPGFPTRDDFSTHAATASSTHIFSPSLTNSLRGDISAAQFLLRPAAEPDAAERARLRLRLVQPARAGTAVLQHQRLHTDRRRHHRAANTTQNTFEIQDGLNLDARRAPDEGRRRVHGTRQSTCSRRLRPTRSSCSPGRSRPTTPSPICCSERR